MFVAWRDLGFAKGRFALMGTVIVLITVLVGLLSGLTAGLGRQNISAITGLSADHLVFGKPADGQKLSFTDSQVTPEQWQAWAAEPGVTSAQPLGITTTKAAAGTRTTALSAFGVPDGSALAPQGARITPARPSCRRPPPRTWATSPPAPTSPWPATASRSRPSTATPRTATPR